MTVMVQCAQHRGCYKNTGEGAAHSAKGPSTGGFVHCPSDPNGRGFDHFKVTHLKLLVSLEIGNKYQGLFKWHLGIPLPHSSFPRTLGRGWQPCSACQELPGAVPGQLTQDRGCTGSQDTGRGWCQIPGLTPASPRGRGGGA